MSPVYFISVPSPGRNRWVVTCPETRSQYRATYSGGRTSSAFSSTFFGSLVDGLIFLGGGGGLPTSHRTPLASSEIDGGASIP